MEYNCSHKDCGPFTKEERPEFYYDETNAKIYCSEGCWELDYETKVPHTEVVPYNCCHKDCGPFTKEERPKFYYDETNDKIYCSEGCWELDPTREKKVKTEDTGKIFEMAICLLYNIHYDGKYKYSMEEAENIKGRLSKLKELFPMCQHTAKGGALYDFTSLELIPQYLSAKSIKKGDGKIAPQTIGQVNPKTFCERLGIPYTNNDDLKKYILYNVTTILPSLLHNTFSCPMILYHKNRQTIRYITLINPIDWNSYKYDWTHDWMIKKSITLKINISGKMIPLMEFQFHTKSRTNMANRWNIENLLNVFSEHFTIKFI